jgi:tripartite-type tricarboxylate transporter receptor subunit TctC
MRVMKWLVCLAAVGALILGGVSLQSGHAAGKDYPTRPITLVGCFGVGGGLDTALRLLSTVLPNHLGTTAVVIAKGGGAGIVAGDFIAKAKPDGYTVAGLVASAAVPEVYTHFRKATYTSKDLTPICVMTTDAFVLSTRADSPYKSLDDLIAAARKNPGKLSYGHAGRGHTFHLVMEQILDKNKVDMRDVPFKGGAMIAAQTTGGHVDCGLHSTVTAKPLVEGKKLRILTVYTPGLKKPGWITTPTAAELGYKLRPHYVGLFLPNGVPDPIVKKLREGMKACITDPVFAKLLKKVGNIPNYQDAEQLRANMKAEKEIVLPLLEKLGMGKK